MKPTARSLGLEKQTPQRNAICGECKQPCVAKYEDTGCGVTEFWGHISNDVCWEVLSDCCGETCYEHIENDGELINEIRIGEF